jgi:hypothetical protein
MRAESEKADAEDAEDQLSAPIIPRTPGCYDTAHDLKQGQYGAWISFFN